MHYPLRAWGVFFITETPFMWSPTLVRTSPAWMLIPSHSDTRDQSPTSKRPLTNVNSTPPDCTQQNPQFAPWMVTNGGEGLPPGGRSVRVGVVAGGSVSG
jgi:hypothetical protein